MNSKFWMIGLLTVTAISTFSLPSRADEATIQENSQDVIVTGDDNFAGQYSNQESRQTRRGNRDNSGVVQRNNQGSDILGDGNATEQDNNQSNVSNSRRNR